jgi:hypothetical protein
MTTENKITVEQFVSEAVREGIALSPMIYLESLEEAAKQDILLTEAGSAQSYLQTLIDEASAEVLKQQ